MHFGDVDSDSYPDLLIIVNINNVTKDCLFQNTRGSKDERIFKPVESETASIISDINNVHQVSFFDLGEDGKLDLIIMNGEPISRSCIVNNMKDDTLMIKILPLTISSQYEEKNNHVSGAFGVTLQWTITLLSGEKKIQLENQRFQLNDGVFQLPYVSMGLGRTNNYVEDLTVGYDGSG